ncbi:hypothetical protein COCNU_scaffold000838G000010 [Cocos nucifera]|nr:hypothetical protein [Cocos nucifera]
MQEVGVASLEPRHRRHQQGWDAGKMDTRGMGNIEKDTKLYSILASTKLVSKDGSEFIEEVGAERPSKKDSRASNDFRIIRVQLDSTSDGDQRSQIGRVPSEPILSLSAPQVNFNFSLEDELAKVAGTSRIAPTEISRTMPASLKLEASTLKDYKLAHELFIRLLLPTDTNKLLSEPCKVVRKEATECFIYLAHYLNGYMEHSLKLSAEARKNKINIETLNIMKDKVEREAVEASIRSNATTRRAKDTEAALR